MSIPDNRSVRPRDKQLEDLMTLKAADVIGGAGDFINMTRIYKNEFPDQYQDFKTSISATISLLCNVAGDQKFGQAILEILFGHDTEFDTN